MRRNRRGRSLILLVCVALLGALLASGATVYALRGRSSHSGAQEAAHPAPRKLEPPVTLGEILVNLADQDALRYCKLTVAVEIGNPAMREKAKEFEPILKDRIIGVLTRRTFRSLHNPGALPKLKEEIQAACAERLPQLEIGEVYFDAFAMQ
ncbi:MAG: flagellar basal body-associated FliL family protein [Armatimonadetes bacterium]|nr:flagellar basal body-associated FliL family protein [Armatimonadota bacterium]